MTVAIYGTKVGMTRIFEGEAAIPVTVIEVQPNEVVEVKTSEKHGYQALQVAVGPKKRAKNLSKAVNGVFKKADVAPRRFLREIPVAGAEAAPGKKLGIEILDAAKICDVTGLTKGRGTTGPVKRWNTSGYPDSHGHFGYRHTGSIGCRMDPGKVFKNKKMAGRYGVEQVTIRNLKIVRIDAEKNLVLVRGAIPGPNGGLVSIRQR